MFGGLRDDDPPDDEQVATQLSALLAELPDAAAPRRREILEELYELCGKAGPRAAPAIPTLIAWPYDADRGTEDAVCYGLCYCAPASIAPLLEQLEHASEQARRRACHVFRLIGNKVGEHLIAVADALLVRLDDVSEDVRSEAAFALGLLHDQRQETVLRLLDLAHGEPACVRASALHAIGNIGQAWLDDHPGEAPSVIAPCSNAVLAALDDPDADVRKSACYALASLGLPVDQHLEHIVQLLETDPSPVVQECAAGQLRPLAERGDISSAATRLAAFLDRERRIGMSVCEALGKIGPPAEAAVPALREALKSANDGIVLAAAEALWSIERKADLILPTLDRLFDRNGEKVCDIACGMGPHARPLLPKLLAALARDDYWDLQWAAEDAIGHVASGDEETLQTLKRAMEHESGIVRSAAAGAFGRIGAPAVPLLLDMLATDVDEKRLEWVVDALGRVGPPASAAVPLLRAKLAGKSRGLRAAINLLSGTSPAARGRGLRIWSAIALARIAADAGAVPTLIEALGDDELADTWEPACMALAAIGAAAAPARDRLVTLTTYPIDDLRHAAELALAAIDRPRS